MIPFNKPFLTGKETEYIRRAVESGKISGDGIFTQKCHEFFQHKYQFRKPLLTTSCTDALEMAAILCDISPRDEVIAPSFTFVSTVNAFMLRGADIVFCDVRSDYPCIDEAHISSLITEKTKVIIVMHYSGIACDMDAIMSLAKKHDLLVVEDAAHALDATYKGRPLGGIGHLGAFSFHETKNIIAGEGGMITVNDERFFERAEIIREKGTDRAKFFRGEIERYSWVDIGSSFLPSEITAAFLFAQLENIDKIQQQRYKIWQQYNEGLSELAGSGKIKLPVLPVFSSNNSHMFYMLTSSREEREMLIDHLAERDVMAIFHYVPLHSSPFFKDRYKGSPLVNTDRYSDTLLRLPMYYELESSQVEHIINSIKSFYASV